MDDLLKGVDAIKGRFQNKTITEKCSDYVKDNPGTVATGAVVGVVGWYTIPVVLSLISWVPYVGAGYYIYTKTNTVQKNYSWYQWGKSWFN